MAGYFRVCFYLFQSITILIGIAIISVGMFLALASNHLITDSYSFADAKDQIHTMIEDMNKREPTRISNPPNITDVDPLNAIRVDKVSKWLSYPFLLTGVLLIVASTLVLFVTIRKLRKLYNVYLIALITFVLVDIVVLILYLRLQDKVLRPLLKNDMVKSYQGLGGNDSISMSWNIFMKKYSCCGVDSYADFNSSNSFNEEWADPFHTKSHKFKIDTSLACCDAIEYTFRPKFIGPCHKEDYIQKKGCLSVVRDAVDEYKPGLCAAISISLILKISSLILGFYNKDKIGKSGKINPIEDVGTKSGKINHLEDVRTKTLSKA